MFPGREMPAFLLPEGRAFSPPQAGAWEPSPAAEQASGHGRHGGLLLLTGHLAHHHTLPLPKATAIAATASQQAEDQQQQHQHQRNGGQQRQLPRQMGHGDGGQQHPPQGGKRRAYTGACRGGGIDGQCRLWQQEQSHQAKVCFFHPCHSLYIQILRTVYHARRPAVHAPAAIF